MATISLTIPDALLPGIAAGVRGSLGEAVDGLDDAQACKRAATERLKELYRSYKVRTATSGAVTAASAALVAREAAARASVQARKDAEAAALARADADFAGVV